MNKGRDQHPDHPSKSNMLPLISRARDALARRLLPLGLAFGKEQPTGSMSTILLRISHLLHESYKAHQVMHRTQERDGVATYPNVIERTSSNSASFRSRQHLTSCFIVLNSSIRLSCSDNAYRYLAFIRRYLTIAGDLPIINPVFGSNREIKCGGIPSSSSSSSSGEGDLLPNPLG